MTKKTLFAALAIVIRMSDYPSGWMRTQVANCRPIKVSDVQAHQSRERFAVLNDRHASTCGDCNPCNPLHRWANTNRTLEPFPQAASRS